MERWENHVAVVTGASSGMGASIFENLALAGLIVIGVARRVHLIQEIIDRQTPEVASRMRAHFCDVRSPQSVDEAYCYITDNFGGIDILIDNAGIFEDGMLIDMEIQKIHNVFSTNLFGYIYWARKAIKSLTERNATGHIILTNSISGHSLIKFPEFSTNAYTISKYGVTALREILADELSMLNNKNIKVTVSLIFF